jgi:hypothetical protein
LTHRLRGNPHGATTLLRRGAKRLKQYGTTHMGVPVGEISDFASATADRIEREGTDVPVEVPPIKKEKT